MTVSSILFIVPFWTCTYLRHPQFTQLDAPRYAIRKYRVATNSVDFAPIIRYAEVVLNQAEAEARNDNDARGLLLLNAICNRTVTTTNRFAVGSLMRMAFIQAILNERRVELMNEGFRWDDIHRLSSSSSSPRPSGGTPAKFLSSQVATAQYNCASGITANPSVPTIAFTNTLFLWPIRTIEVANSATLARQQNPGY